MNKRGFTLLEVLLAVFIIMVGLLSLYGAINYSYSSVQKTKDRFTAAYLAQEGIEIVKNIRDSNFVAESNWTLGLTSCSSIYGCRADYNDYELTQNTDEDDASIPLYVNDNGFYNYDYGDYTVFSRRIFIEADGGEKLDISVVVNWGDNEFLLEESLYNWK